jgi:hypothetical protein
MTSEDGIPAAPDEDRPDRDAEVDEEEEESFPASDPPSSWSGQHSG